MTSHVLEKAKRAVSESGLTHEEIGLRMGYSKESARQSVWQFLHGTNPSLAMMCKLAKALGVELGDLL